MQGFKVFFGFVSMMLIVTVVAMAQGDVIQPPALDASTKELVEFAIALDGANGKTLKARYDALMATGEGKAYLAAQDERQKSRIEIQNRIKAKVPGFELDFETSRLVPSKAPKK